MVNAKALGLTAGIFWAIVIAWSVLMGLLGRGVGAYECMNSFYLGWIPLSWAGLGFGAVLGFVDGLVFGFLFSWVYNKLGSKFKAQS